MVNLALSEYSSLFSYMVPKVSLMTATIMFSKMTVLSKVAITKQEKRIRDSKTLYPKKLSILNSPRLNRY